MSQERIIEDVSRILNEQHEYMKIFDTLEEYVVTQENLAVIENLINLLEMHEEMLRTIRKNLTLKCQGHHLLGIMKRLEDEEKLWSEFRE
jgi:hypothetical protein